MHGLQSACRFLVVDTLRFSTIKFLEALKSDRVCTASEHVHYLFMRIIVSFTAQRSTDLLFTHLVL